jgi:hypothetical protein
MVGALATDRSDQPFGERWSYQFGRRAVPVQKKTRKVKKFI